MKSVPARFAPDDGETSAAGALGRTMQVALTTLLGGLLYSVPSAGKGGAPCRQLRACVLLKNNDLN
jgi:hypothetical protein